MQKIHQMSEEEIKSFKKVLKEYQENIDKETAYIFLKKLGILTEKGNISRKYKTICIPKEQA